eukprot:2953268-Karenia_brevis.AAC.1
MPRNPALFDRETRWPRYGNMDDEVDPESKSDYVSAGDYAKEAEEMFEQDVQMGHMRKLPKSDAER